MPKKNPHSLGAGFFFSFLHASARAATYCGIGDSDNGGIQAGITHYALSQKLHSPLLVKAIVGLSQIISLLCHLSNQ